MKNAPFERYRELVDDWAAFQDALARPLPTTIWLHPDRVGAMLRSQLLGDQATPAIPPGMWRLPGDLRMGGRWEFFAGLYQIVEETSALPVLLLDPQPGERVLDLCAAPGMKTLMLSAAMGDCGTVVANDLNRRRLKGLRQSIERFGATNVCITNADGANYPPAAGSFDRILVDVPCSCEGTTRKHPELAQAIDDSFSRRKSGVQKALLRKAVQLCRPGGRIVYSTCTYAPEENEAVVDAILREMAGEVRLLPAHIDVFTASPGLTAWDGATWDASLAQTMRVWPHQNDTGGFFVALLEKTGPTTIGIAPPPFVPQPPDPAHLVSLAERFGIPAADLQGLPLHATADGLLYLTAPGLQPPTEPRPDVLGLPFARTTTAVPKLTVPGALKIGHLATRQRLQLDAPQLQSYLAREVFPVPDLGACTPGYILLASQDHIIGTGLLMEDNQIRSLFPRSWKRTRRT